MTGLNKVNGLSLFEVLVSLLLISLILFGLETGQVYSIKQARMAWFLNTAMNQMNNATERLIALQTYGGLKEQTDLWNAENKRVLPSGFGTLSGAWPNYSVTIYWGKISHHCAKQKTGSSGCLRQKIQLA